jgi:hypothetical protein
MARQSAKSVDRKRNPVKLRLRPALLTLALGVALALPLVAAAQGSRETTSLQVSVTLPDGQQLSGSVVDQRVLGPSITSDWSFNGMLNGKPASAAGAAEQRWLGDGKLEVTLTDVTAFSLDGRSVPTNIEGKPDVPQLIGQTLLVETTGDGIVTVRGIPLAIGGTLLPPGSGDQTFVITNAAAGTGQVSEIPNATAAPTAAPVASPAPATAPTAAAVVPAAAAAPTAPAAPVALIAGLLLVAVAGGAALVVAARRRQAK